VVEISERVRRLAAEGGWIGVDLDGTMFTYGEWVPWNVFGEPIWPMIKRVQAWLAADIGVRIVTARVGLPVGQYKHPFTKRLCYQFSPQLSHTCRVTGEKFSDELMDRAIQTHCDLYGIPRLPVQPHKDLDMIEIWDDRAIQVIANTGRTLAEEHAAELIAQRGKQFQGK
jgi:hypothetical protein